MATRWRIRSDRPRASTDSELPEYEAIRRARSRAPQASVPRTGRLTDLLVRLLVHAHACSRGRDVTRCEVTATLVRARLATRRAARARRGALQAWRARRVRPGHVHTSQLSCGKPGRGPGRGILAGGAEPRVHRHREGTYARLASGELLHGVRRADRDASTFEYFSFSSSNETNHDRGGGQEEAVRPATTAERRAVKVRVPFRN